MITLMLVFFNLTSPGQDGGEPGPPLCLTDAECAAPLLCDPSTGCVPGQFWHLKGSSEPPHKELVGFFLISYRVSQRKGGFRR